jgi:hypothetical protein
VEDFEMEEQIGQCRIWYFKCQWVKHPQGVEINDYGFTIIDLRNVDHKDEKKYIVVPGKQ